MLMPLAPKAVQVGEDGRAGQGPKAAESNVVQLSILDFFSGVFLMDIEAKSGGTKTGTFEKWGPLPFWPLGSAAPGLC